jgi:TM2 domain-containing membrane protein YozV
MDAVTKEQWALALLTATFDCSQQKFFQAEYGRRRRSPAVALALCLTLGAFGAHEFYMGRLVSATLRLLCCWTLIPLLLALIDAWFITRRAHAYNTRMAHALAEIVEESFAAVRADAEAQVGMAYLRTPPMPARLQQAQREQREQPTWLQGTPDWLILRENDGSR